MEAGGITEKYSPRSLFAKGMALFLLLAPACGLEPGVPVCGNAAPSGGVLTYQGSFASNAHGISGLVRTYLVNGLVVVSLENVQMPSYTSLRFVLGSQMHATFSHGTVRQENCFQTLQTGKGMQGGDRLVQATLSVPGGTALATALLSSTLPSGTPFLMEASEFDPWDQVDEGVTEWEEEF